MLDRAAGTPSSPGMYGTGGWPVVPVGAVVRSDMLFLRCLGASLVRERVRFQVPNGTILPGAAAARSERLDAPDRFRIVGEEPGWNQPRDQLDPPSVVREHLPEEGSGFLLASQLPERGRLPEEKLVVSRREPGGFRVGRERLLHLSFRDEGVP